MPVRHDPVSTGFAAAAIARRQKTAVAIAIVASLISAVLALSKSTKLSAARVAASERSSLSVAASPSNALHRRDNFALKRYQLSASEPLSYQSIRIRLTGLCRLL